MSGFGVNSCVEGEPRDLVPIVAAISQGLHKAAQPLTVLQGMLEQALIEAHTPEEYRAIIVRLMGEARRVTHCFEHLRELAQVRESGLIAANVRAIPETESQHV
jgi:signal transduction histidine kinase